MEIEKKYLVSKLNFNPEKYPSKEIEQGYISTDPVIRIRKYGKDYILTIKGKGHLAREEYELDISAVQYQNLLSKVDNSIITKIRYYIPLNDSLTAELDVYEGFLKGLMTVEVEFPTIEEAENFISPSWFGKDVTFDKRYKNASLSIYGIPEN